MHKTGFLTILWRALKTNIRNRIFDNGPNALRNARQGRLGGQKKCEKCTKTTEKCWQKKKKHDAAGYAEPASSV